MRSSPGSSLLHYVLVISIVSTIVLGVIPSVVCWLKGKRAWAIVGFFSAWHIIAAFRLAKPESWWAQRFYSETKLVTARARFTAEEDRPTAPEDDITPRRSGVAS